MICFEVSVNGEKRFTAGVGESGVLVTILTWVSHEPEKLARWKGQGITDLTPMELFVSVSGTMDNDERQHEHLKWGRGDLSVGDEIRIRIIESPVCDPPESRRHNDPDAELESKKEYVRNLAKELGWEIRTAETAC